MSWYNVLNFFTFVSFAFILWISSNKSDEYYTRNRLGITVFVYSFIFVGLYLVMSDYYTGNTFLFSVADARTYERYSLAIVNSDMTIQEAISFLVKHRFDYDDWGAFIFMLYPYSIIKSKLALNFAYITLGTISSIFLFDIGNRFMLRSYAYLASLSYSIASYSLFFYGSHLKETAMLFFVTISFFCFFKYMDSRKSSNMLFGIIFSSILFFFRPVIAVLIWMSIMASYVLGKKNGSKTLIVGFIVIMIIPISYFVVNDILMQYTAQGDLLNSPNYVEDNSSFSIAVSAVGAFLGPIPILLQIKNAFSPSPIYGSGLLLKCLLLVPFYNGLVYCYKKRNPFLLSLYSFTIAEMVCLAIVKDGLELRKALAHVPFFILSAFWFLSEYDKDVDEEIYISPYYISTRRWFYLSAIVFFVVVIAWNTLRY